MIVTHFLPKFQVSVQSGQLAVRSALEKLLTQLEPLHLDVEEAGTIELVLAEALNNVVEHGYPPSSEGGAIDISCSHKRDGLHFEICDQGLPMPSGETPIGSKVDLNVPMQDMPEGGFGWFLIKDLAKDIDYARQGNSNHLRLRLNVRCA
jgi:serine/threonine-protein kinase RsbW